MTASRKELGRLPAGTEVVWAEERGGHASAVVRTGLPTASLPGRAGPVALEELVLGYMSRANSHTAGVREGVR